MGDLAAGLARAQQDRDGDYARTLLARADRLAALGTLAAGIAHEIRNPLVSVRTFIELLPERLEDEEFRTQFRELALSEIERICELLNDLLSFARPFPADADPSDPRELVAQTVRLLEPEARKRGASLVVSCTGDVPSVAVEAGRLKQVLMNLVLNALDATSHRGTVDIAASAAEGGAWTRLEVRDRGPGIAPDILARLFQPFVTDKETGSGLGLYVAHRIVTEHGGTLAVQARRGGGTAFTVLLPAVETESDAGAG